jgi:hypothetical protein
MATTASNLRWIRTPGEGGAAGSRISGSKGIRFLMGRGGLDGAISNPVARPIAVETGALHFRCKTSMTRN